MSSESEKESDKECPLCMEAFDFDDVNFFPCSCAYQICRFCWHRIRTDENGLCPACRQPYPEDPVNFQPLSTAEIQKIKSEKRQKIQQQKSKVSESRKHLSAYRVLQRNLVYVIGLSQRMADPEMLKKTEFFGKFGKIVKIAVGAAPTNAGSTLQTTSYTAYVTYGKIDDALRCIETINNLVVDGRMMKASLGTTKYCSNFLKGQSCHKQECMYLHEVADDEFSFTKEDMHQGKHTECERRLHEQLNQQTQQQLQQQQRQEQPSVELQQTTMLGQTNGKSNSSSNIASMVCKNNSLQRESSSDTEMPVLQTNIFEPPPLQTNIFEPPPGFSRALPPVRLQTDSKAPSSDSKLVMTCDELERILLNSIIPPGFQSQEVKFKHEETSAPASTTNSSRQTPVPYGNNFFDDLYDDLGFDPFSESSKALADMLEEEKTSNARS